MRRTIGRFHLIAEIGTILISAVAFSGIALSVSDSITRIFMTESRKATETIDFFSAQFLKEQLASFVRLSETQNQESAASVLIRFEDVYRIDPEYRVTRLIKLGRGSFLFDGFDFSGSQIEPFLYGTTLGVPSVTPVMRAVEDARISVYFTLRLKAGWLLARLPLDGLIADIGKVSDASGSHFYLATTDGFVFSSSDPAKTFAMLPQVPSGSLLGDRFYSERTGSVFNIKIAVMYPASTLTAIRDTWLRFFLGFMAVLVVLGAAKYVLERRMIIAPLNRFVKAVSGWRGDSEPSGGAAGRIAPEEIRILDREFQEARRRIAESFRAEAAMGRELAALNTSLEARVAERTYELEEMNREMAARNAELAAAIEDLDRARALLVNQEKLAALGTLASGVAHELNTPLGAVISSVSFAEEALPETVKETGAFLSTLGEADRVLFFEALATAEIAIEPGFAEGRELAARTREACAARGWANPRNAADKLVSSGIAADPALSARIFASPVGQEMTSRVWKYWGMARGIGIARRAAEKAARVVAALRNYSWDTSVPGDRVEIRSEIETVLTLFENKMKRNVELSLDLEQGLVVIGNSDRLSQVWTNLIANALQAMGHSGRLGVSARRVGKEAVVAVEDSGSGIPAEAAAKVFEPFFTTKPKGEGTGLGLDISRRIVESMNGNISFASEPGKTVFTVRLPLASEGGEQR